MDDKIIWWTIKRIYGRGNPQIHSYYVDESKRGAIKKLQYNLHDKYTWRQLKAMGFSAVKIQIKEIK